MLKASLAAIGLLSACSVANSYQVERVFTPRELNHRPEIYDGREVAVRGYFVFGTNGRSLYESEERLEALRTVLRAKMPDVDASDYDADCLTLLDVHTLVRDWVLVPGQTVTVYGRFQSNYLDGQVVDLQACGAPTALALDAEKTKRALETAARH